MSNNDVTLSHVLLTGYVEEDKQQLPHTKYLDADNESDGRRALAKLLRSDTPLDRTVRDALAALFDPDNELFDKQRKHWPYVPNDRKLTFSFRSRKRRADHMRNTAIVQDLYSNVKSGNVVEEAIAKTAAKFRLSEDSVKRLWQRYGWARQNNIFG